MSNHHFYHGDFGWDVDTDSGFVEWDCDGDEEPTDDDVEAASDHWHTSGHNDYLCDIADEIGDMKYEIARERTWEE